MFIQREEIITAIKVETEEDVINYLNFIVETNRTMEVFRDLEVRQEHRLPFANYLKEIERLEASVVQEEMVEEKEAVTTELIDPPAPKAKTTRNRTPGYSSPQKTWTESENKRLSGRISSNQSPKVIAAALKRSASSIAGKALRYYEKKWDSNNNIWRDWDTKNNCWKV